MIHDPSQGSAAAFAAAGSAAPANQQAAQASFAPSAERHSFQSLGNVGGILRAATTEALIKGYEAVQTAIKESRFSQAYKVLAAQIDNQSETRLKFSSIVLILQHQASNNIAHHTLLLEDSREPLGTKMEQINGVQVQIDSFAAQYYDAVYASAVDRTMASAFPNTRILNTGCTVVPRGFQWADAKISRELVVNAMVAAATYLEATLPDFIDMDMTKVGSGEQLQVQVSWDNPQTTDYTDLPVRSDIQIVCSAVSQKSESQESRNSEVSTISVSRVTGFMDLTYEEPAQDFNQAYAQQVAVGAYRKYRPRFVITRLENNMRMTPAGQLFAIASTLCIGEGNTYFRAFKPRLNVTGRDPKNVGAVNIEANMPVPPTNQPDPSGFGNLVDTKGSEFGDRELGQLISLTMHPGVVFSIDVSDAGADTWYNSVFSRAAGGDIEANREILKAANTLTGGAFAQLYGTSNNFVPVLRTDERVLLGYYTNKDGQRADIRDVDYLAVLNILGINDRQQIVNWSDSIERTNEPLMLRLQGRKTIIRAIADQVVFTQQGTRATLNPEFLNMLLKALEQVKTGFKLVNMGMAGDYTSQRAGGTFGQAGMGIGISNLFNVGFGGTQQQATARPYQPQSMY